MPDASDLADPACRSSRVNWTDGSPYNRNNFCTCANLDIANGRFRLLDAADAARLPASLVAYFDDLIYDAQLSDDRTYQGLVGLLISVVYGTRRNGAQSPWG